MEKKISKILLFMFVICTIMSTEILVSASTNGYSQEQAVAFIKSMIGKKYDVKPKNNSYDCVDLANEYYHTVGGQDYKARGNGGDFCTNALPSGWKRYYVSNGYSPQAGDVVSWAAGGGWGKYGHVALVLSVSSSDKTITVVEQSTSRQIAATKATYKWSSPTCFIHPDFEQKPAIPKVKSKSDVTATSVTLNWDKVSGATDYKVTWKKAGDANHNSGKKTGNKTSLNISGLESGKLYWFRLYAINDSGETAAEKSYGVYLTPKTPTAHWIDSTNSIKVDWNGAGGQTNYSIYIRKSGGDYGEKPAVTLKNQYTYTFTGLDAGSQYYFKVKEENIEDTSVVSGRSESGSSFTKLNQPTVTGTTSNSVSLSWSRSSMDGAYSYTYVVRRRVSGTTDYIDSPHLTDTTYTDTGLSPNTSYDYYIDVYRTKDGVTKWCTNSVGITTSTGSQGTTGIAVEPNNLALTEGETYKLNASVYPSDASDKTVRWASTDTNIASVSGDGTITAIHTGNVNITATAAGGQQAECNLRVNLKDTEPPTISNFKITNLNASSFNIECDMSDNIGVREAKIHIYGQEGYKSDFWITVPAENGHFTHTIDTSSYYGQGTYWIGIQAFDGANLSETTYSADAFNAINENEVLPIKTEIYDGHIYQVYDIDGVTWNGARVFAGNRQGHLVTITDEDENEFVKSLIASSEKKCFIGATDWIDDGEFLWCTGEPFEYTNWSEGEPNNTDTETVIEMYYADGKWNDCKDSKSGRLIVVENEPHVEAKIVSGESLYYVYDYVPDYDTASKYCEVFGGHLATITNQDENDIIANSLIYDKDYYLGATDIENEGVWKWVTGEDFSYTNWHTKGEIWDWDEPNDLGNQDHLVIRRNKWDDIGGRLPGDIIGFICEYKLPPRVILEYNALELNVGEKYLLRADIQPTSANIDDILWSSSDTDIITVSEDGVVQTISSGTATVNVTVTVNEVEVTDICVVTVADGTTPISTPTPTQKPDEPTPPITDGAVVKVSSVTASAGDTVNVTVDLSDNKGFANLGIQVGYDADNLTLTSVTNNESIGATYTGAQSITANPYNMGWDSTNNITYNGNLATLTFKVKENAAEGKYPITVSYYTGIGSNYTDGEDVNYDADFNSLGLNYVNGAINVSSHIAGDINGDGKVNNQDGTFLLRHLAGWNVNVDESALDVNGDGRVNNQDGTVLLRYLAGWSVTIH